MEFTKTVVLAVLICCVNFVHRAKGGCLDELHFTGTHYDFGYCIGVQYKQEIQSLINGNYSFFTDKLEPWYYLPSSVASMGIWKARFASAYTHYEDEMKGMAAGAEMDINMLYVLNFEPEIANSLNSHPETLDGAETYKMQYASGTTFLNNRYITHFVDWEPIFDEAGFMVDAKIIDPKFPAIEDQEFRAFMYPGYLPGNVFGYNKFGFFYTSNRLFQAQNPQVSLFPSCLYLRDLLAAHNISRAYEITTEGGAAKKFALSLNLNMYETDGGSSFTYVEWALDAPTGLSISDTGLLTSTANLYYHFNNYKILTGNAVTSTYYTPLASEYRESNAAIWHLTGVPSTYAQVKTYVSNEDFFDFPKYRDVTKYTDHVTTISMIYDVTGRTMNVFTGKPDSSAESLILTP